jgi:hypothetical protein
LFFGELSRYRLLPNGYSIRLVLPKLFERVMPSSLPAFFREYGPMAELRVQNRSPFDRLYQRLVDDLDALIQFVGLVASGTMV